MESKLQKGDWGEWWVYNAQDCHTTDLNPTGCCNAKSDDGQKKKK